MLGADAEIIGPIQMGLNKPIHFVDFGASVRDVVNIVAVATIDAYVDKIKNRISQSWAHSGNFCLWHITYFGEMREKTLFSFISLFYFVLFL